MLGSTEAPLLTVIVWCAWWVVKARTRPFGDILAAALAGLAAAGSPGYARLAGLAALLTAGMLLTARLARLAFLSRTVLAGFLTGVGIQVAAGQLPDMLGSAPRARRSRPSARPAGKPGLVLTGRRACR